MKFSITAFCVIPSHINLHGICTILNLSRKAREPDWNPPRAGLRGPLLYSIGYNLTKAKGHLKFVRQAR